MNFFQTKEWDASNVILTGSSDGVVRVSFGCGFWDGFEDFNAFFESFSTKSCIQ